MHAEQKKTESRGGDESWHMLYSHASCLTTRMAMSAIHHHFGPDWNISTVTKKISVKFNRLQTFLVRTRWILLTLVILWLFVWCYKETTDFSCFGWNVSTNFGWIALKIFHVPSKWNVITTVILLSSTIIRSKIKYVFDLWCKLKIVQSASAVLWVL